MNCNNQRPNMRYSSGCNCQRNCMEKNNIERMRSEQNRMDNTRLEENSCSNPFQSFSQSQLMQYINEVSFAVDDILLYLDTHPNDKDALSFFHDNVSKRIVAMKYYASQYGPLTVDAAHDNESCSWKWVEQPWPWEGGCC